MKQKLKKQINILFMLFCFTMVNSCRSNSVGGTIPLYMDEYVSTTQDRRMELKEEMVGYIIKYQKAYDCNHAIYKYNATAIVSVNSEFITIYDYCQQYEFKPGQKVKIKPTKPINNKSILREILEPFPKSSNNYGYWKCISCQYKNAFGTIDLL